MQIPTVKIDTTLLPVADQFAAWAQHSGNTRLVPVHPGAFLARGTFWNLGPVYVTEVHLDPFISDRDQHLVNAAATDYVQLVALFQGTVRLETSGSDVL